jgi:tripartite ATP-independent transporter DctP family solute receptor
VSSFSRFVLAVVLAAFLSVSAAQARDFQSSDVQPADHPAVKAVAYMGDLMRQRSGRRLGIASVGAGDKDSEIFTVAQVRTGALDMARISASSLHGSAPGMVVPSLPFLFTSVEHRRQSLDGPVGEELLASLQAVDLIGLCFYDSGPRSIYTVSKPIRTLADLKGLKIRVQASSAMAEVMQALGAQPLSTPYGQIRTRLASGTIDAAEDNLVAFRASGQHMVAKVFSLTEHTAPPAVVIFSKQVWDRLSADDQAIIRQAARESVVYYRKLADEQEAAARRELAESGVQFIADVDKPAFSRILTPLYSSLVPDPRYRVLLQQIRPTQ